MYSRTVPVLVLRQIPQLASSTGTKELSSAPQVFNADVRSSVVLWALSVTGPFFQCLSVDVLSHPSSLLEQHRASRHRQRSSSSFMILQDFRSQWHGNPSEIVHASGVDVLKGEAARACAQVAAAIAPTQPPSRFP